MSLGLEELVSAFLWMYHAPKPAEVRIWILALQPYEDQVDQAMAEWSRGNDKAPTPADIIRLIHAGKQISSMHSIVLRTAVRNGLTMSDMVSRSRENHLVAARIEAISEMLAAGFSTAQIGQTLKRDGSTIRYMARQAGVTRTAQFAAFNTHH